MGKLISVSFEEEAVQRKESREKTSCPHKNVTVYAACRQVLCTFCGAELDPFDVLLDMVKGYIPAHTRDDKVRMEEEQTRRFQKREKPKKDPK